MSMEEDLFAQYSFGKLALQKMAKGKGSISPNFRLYSAALIDDLPQNGMVVNGAEFLRDAAGELNIMVGGTSKQVKLTQAEIVAFKGQEVTP